MILNLFRRASSHDIVERLYTEIVAAARRPAFFVEPVGVSDTVEGRFEVLALHAFVVLRRLSALPAPAPAMAQELADRIFIGFDAALREMGVGDLTVPKRMKKLAGDFGGRSAVYARALDGDGSLEAAIARNVYGADDYSRGVVLAQWLLSARAALESADLADFERGLPALPLPDAEMRA